MPCGWEGNCRSGVALAMRHCTLQWFIHLRTYGLQREKSTPPIHLIEYGSGTLYLLPLPRRYRNSHAIWDHTEYPPPGRGDIPACTPAKLVLDLETPEDAKLS